MSGCGGTRKTRQNVSDSVCRTISHAVHCFIAKHHAHRKASWRATQYLINAARGKATWCYANTVHLLVKNHFSIGFPSAIITVCQRACPAVLYSNPTRIAATNLIAACAARTCATRPAFLRYSSSSSSTSGFSTSFRDTFDSESNTAGA